MDTTKGSLDDSEWIIQMAVPADGTMVHSDIATTSSHTRASLDEYNVE